jgi:hypothetical protein
MLPRPPDALHHGGGNFFSQRAPLNFVDSVAPRANHLAKFATEILMFPNNQTKWPAAAPAGLSGSPSTL